jgi:hypothetical protein
VLRSWGPFRDGPGWRRPTGAACRASARTDEPPTSRTARPGGASFASRLIPDLPSRCQAMTDLLGRLPWGPGQDTTRATRYQNLWGKHDPGPQITCVVMREFASCYTEVYAIFDRFREKTILLPGRLVNPAVAVRRSRQARFRRAGLAPRPCAADLAQGLNDPAAGARPVGREAGRDEVSEAEVTTGTCSAQTRP